MGTMLTIQSTIYADFFGRKHVGEISSIAMTFKVVGGAVGPLFLGLMSDASGGDFGLALTLASAMPLGLAVATHWLRRPPRPRPTEELGTDI